MKINLSYGNNRWQCPKCNDKYQGVRHSGGLGEEQSRVATCKKCGFKALIITTVIPVQTYEVQIIKAEEATK